MHYTLNKETCSRSPLLLDGSLDRLAHDHRMIHSFGHRRVHVTLMLHMLFSEYCPTRALIASFAFHFLHVLP